MERGIVFRTYRPHKGPLTRLYWRRLPGLLARQRAQHHQPRHETPIGVRFAGRDKLVYLIGNGEASPRRWWGFAERLHRAGQIGEGFTDR